MLRKGRILILFNIICLIPLFLSGCKDKIVVNNAFVYLVHDSCINYGSISGQQWQSVFVDEYSTEVTAVAKNGYVFIGWSDGGKKPSRIDLATSANDRGPVVFYAYFEAIDE